MFYFLYGNSPTIEFETEKIIKEILEKHSSITPKFFDCFLKEEDEFINALQVNSIFKTIDFLILKRAEILKNIGIQKLFKSIKNYNLDEKNIIIIYNFPTQYGKILSEYELTKTSVKSIEELCILKNCINTKDNNATLNYVKQKLNISEKEAKNFIELLGDDYYHIKNETNKVAIISEEFLVLKKFSIKSFILYSLSTLIKFLIFSKE